MSRDRLLYPELSYAIVGLCYEAHNELGSYAKEKHYADQIEKRLKAESIPYEREARIADTGNIADFIIDDLIILELKSVRVLQKSEFYQVQRYLHVTNKKLGLLVNFRAKYLSPKRILRVDNFKFKEISN